MASLMEMETEVEVLAADGCEDGVYETEESAALKEDEMFAQAWFSLGHNSSEIEGEYSYGPYAW